MTIAPISDAGVRALRLSPQACDMLSVISAFRGAADARIEAAEAAHLLKRAYPDATFSNGFLHARPGHELIATAQGLDSAAAPS